MTEYFGNKKPSINKIAKEEMSDEISDYLDYKEVKEDEFKTEEEISISERLSQINEEEITQAWEKYDNILDDYCDRHEEIKRILRRSRGVEQETSTRNMINCIDSERHVLHLQLLEIGKKIGKNEYEVKMDILRNGKTLEEYGLSEFSLADSSDLYKPEDRDKLEDIKYELEYFKNRFSDKKISYPNKNEAMLVFVDEYDADLTCYKDSYENQIIDKMFENDIKRAKRFARDNGLRFIQAPFCTHWYEQPADNEWGFETFPQSFALKVGVSVPIDNLEKYLEIIKNNPDKYNIDEKYYSEEEITPINQLRTLQEEAERKLQEDRKNKLDAKIEELFYRYRSKREFCLLKKNDFIERIKRKIQSKFYYKRMVKEYRYNEEEIDQAIDNYIAENNI